MKISKKSHFVPKIPMGNENYKIIESILAPSSHGEKIYMGYGYFSNSKITKNLCEKIVQWLNKDINRSIYILIGQMNNENSILKDIIQLFPKKLKPSLTERITIKVVHEFHCKFLIKTSKNGAYDKFRDEDENHVRLVERPISGLFGSSNFSSSALSENNRFELDLYLSEDSNLIDQLFESIKYIIENSREFVNEEISFDIEYQIYLKKYLSEEREKEKLREANKRANYYYDMSHREAKAFIESDIEQGIFGNGN